MKTEVRIAVSFLLVVAGIAQARTGSALAAEVAVTTEKYCVGNPGVVAFDEEPPGAITLRITTHTRFRNQGKHPLIVPFAYSLSAVTANYRIDLRYPCCVSVVNQRAGADRFATRFAEYRLLDQLAAVLMFKRPSGMASKEFSEESPAAPFFMVIPPGGESAVPFRQYVVLSAYNPMIWSTDTGLLGKRIRLRLEFSHHRLSPAFAGRLATKWKRYGELWQGASKSNEIEIVIPAQPVIGDCSHEYEFCGNELHEW